MGAFLFGCLRRLLPWAFCLNTVWAMDGPTLRMVTDEWPPFEYAAQGKVDGFSVALCETVLNGMGVKLIKPRTTLPWARAMATVASGQGDVVFSALWARERNYPSEPLIHTRYALFARLADPPAVKGPHDLRDLRLGTVHQFYYPDGFIDNLPKSVAVVAAFTSEANLENLLCGQVDLVVEDQYTAQFIIRQRKWQDRIGREPLFKLSDSGLFAVFSRKTVSLERVEAFSRRLHEFKQTPAYRELAARYGITP
jgi:polar amino acid transport system substrate-binding protein